jgi:hypothetical protein
MIMTIGRVMADHQLFDISLLEKCYALLNRRMPPACFGFHLIISKHTSPDNHISTSYKIG